MARIIGNVKIIKHPTTGEHVQSDTVVNLYVANAHAIVAERELKKEVARKAREKRNKDGIKSPLWMYIDKATRRKLAQLAK
jgi:hypothetical protein